VSNPGTIANKCDSEEVEDGSSDVVSYSPVKTGIDSARYDTRVSIVISIITPTHDKLRPFQNSLILIMLKLFAKYMSIGIINTLIHWVVFALCIYAFHTNQAMANFAGFVVAVSFSFFANARFTFGSSTTAARYMLYVGFMGTLSATVGWAADRCGLPPIMTLIVFSAISLVCGFIYSKFIVFRDAK